MEKTYAERLQAELDKVPRGMRYIEAPNFHALYKLLKEGTPYYDIEDTVYEGSKNENDRHTA